MSLCTKFKSKWNKYLNTGPDTLNLAEKIVKKSLELMGTGKDFLNRVLFMLALRSQLINGYHETEKPFHGKGHPHLDSKQPTE